jgi:hypothetical protein
VSDRVNCEPPAHLRRYVGIALQGHIRMLRRNGQPAPEGLEPYVTRLMAPVDDVMTRRKVLQAASSARYRARKKEQRAA